MKQTVEISGVWLRRSGDSIIVAVELDGKWHDVITENQDANFSHITEPSSILAAAETPL
jgi:hypothetical protein